MKIVNDKIFKIIGYIVVMVVVVLFFIGNDNKSSEFSKYWNSKEIEKKLLKGEKISKSAEKNVCNDKHFFHLLPEIVHNRIKNKEHLEQSMIVNDNFSIYYDFSLATIAIENKNYEQALEISKDIQEKIPHDCKFLNIVNALRIFSLQSIVKSRVSNFCKDDFVQYAKDHKLETELEKICNIYSIESFSLKEFLK